LEGDLFKTTLYEKAFYGGWDELTVKTKKHIVEQQEKVNSKSLLKFWGKNFVWLWAIHVTSVPDPGRRAV
jgi:hypothetical protein